MQKEVSATHPCFVLPNIPIEYPREVTISFHTKRVYKGDNHRIAAGGGRRVLKGGNSQCLVPAAPGGEWLSCHHASTPPGRRCRLHRSLSRSSYPAESANTSIHIIIKGTQIPVPWHFLWENKSKWWQPYFCLYVKCTMVKKWVISNHM